MRTKIHYSQKEVTVACISYGVLAVDFKKSKWNSIKSQVNGATLLKVNTNKTSTHGTLLVQIFCMKSLH